MGNVSFKAQFHDAGQLQPRTPIGVLPLGAHPRHLQPDETYLRLRSILRKKQKQLPKGKPGVIVLEISDLERLVDEFTLARTLYGDLLVVIRGGHGAEHFPHEMQRKPNGFFMGTTRVSAAVVVALKPSSTFGRDTHKRTFPSDTKNG